MIRDPPQVLVAVLKIINCVCSNRPRLNNDISIEVQSTESLRYLSYQVIGRGDVIYANTIEIPNRKTHVISFLASFAMVPKAHFIVYYIKDDEIILDKLEMELAEDLQNFVSGLCSKNRLKVRSQKSFSPIATVSLSLPITIVLKWIRSGFTRKA